MQREPLARETAAADDGPRVFTEDEHLALLADRVARETSVLREQVAALTTAADTLVVERDAAAAARDAATAELAAYRAQVEHERVVAERTGTRSAAVAEVVVDPAFVTPERAARWAAMDDEQFAAVLDDLRAATTAGAPAASGAPGAPRQTAAFTAAASRPVVATATGSDTTGRRLLALALGQ